MKKGFKICKKCGTEKLIKEFGKFLSTTGLRVVNRVCSKCYRSKRSLPVQRLIHTFKNRCYAFLNPQKAKVKVTVHWALKSGKLIKPSQCAYPGCAHSRIEAHHFDYTRPLFVRWFCKSHHGLADKITNAIEKYCPEKLSLIN